MCLSTYGFMSSLRDLQSVIIRDPRTCIRGYHMPLLQNSVAQHQNAQASSSWSLPKPTGLRHELVFPNGSLPQILSGVVECSCPAFNAQAGKSAHPTNVSTLVHSTSTLTASTQTGTRSYSSAEPIRRRRLWLSR